MAVPAQQNLPAGALSGGGQRIKVGVMPLFSTWIYRCEDGPRQLNERLEQLARRLMQDDRNAPRLNQERAASSEGRLVCESIIRGSSPANICAPPRRGSDNPSRYRMIATCWFLRMHSLTASGVFSQCSSVFHE